MKSSTCRSTIVSSLATRYILAMMSIGMAAAIGIAAEKPQPRLDRFGDPLPPGAIRRFGTLRFRHVWIEDVAFTPDGKRLIAGDGGVGLAVFDATTGRKLREVGESSRGGLGGFAISADGKWLASCGEDLVLWDIETGRLVRELHCPHCKSPVFSADGKILAVGGRRRDEITLVEVATGKQVAKWTFKEGNKLPFDSQPLAFSPEGKYLAGLFCELREVKPQQTTIVSSQVWLLDAKTGSRVRAFGSTGALIGAFAFQPRTGRLATIEEKGVLRFWNVETGKETHHYSIALGKWDNKDRPPPKVLRFSADGHRCAVADGVAELLVVVDARTGREVRRIEIAKTADWITAELSPDGRAIASARSYGPSSCVRVWDVDSGAERVGGIGPRTPPMLSLSADEHILIGRSEDGQVIHWDRRSGQAVQQRTEIPGQDGRLIRPLGTAGEWTLRGPRWRLSLDVATRTLAIHSLEGERMLGEAEWPALMRDLALSPDGVHVATTSFVRGFRNTVLLWNPEKEKKPRRLTADVEFFRKLHFSHDGKRLIATAQAQNASPSAALWVWDAATARPIHKLAAHSALGEMLLTADDRLLIYGGLDEGTAHVWDMETGKELAQFPNPPSKRPSEIGGLGLSTDERFLAVIFSQDGGSIVSVWETGSWKPIRIFPPTQRPNGSESMLFSRDGRSLFTSNSDTTILEWEVAGRLDHKTEVPNKDRLNVLWRTLIETPDKAYPAVWEMLDHPEASVPFLIEKVSPAKEVEEQRVRQLLAQLDSESFVQREEASHQLLALGEQIVPMLRQALKERPSLEMKKRVEGAIEALNRLPTPEQLRLLRALAVLEWSNRPEAVAHLRRLAGGAASARLTRAAKAAWQRR